MLLKLEKSVTKLCKENNWRKYRLRSTVSNHWYSIHYMLEWFQEQQTTVRCYNAKDKKGTTACRPDFPSVSPGVSGATSLAQMSSSLEKRARSQGLLRPAAPPVLLEASAAPAGFAHGKYLRGTTRCVRQSLLVLLSLRRPQAQLRISGEQEPALCGSSLHNPFKSLSF